MEPHTIDINDASLDTTITPEKMTARSWHTPLTKVTLTSKIIAAIVMILLPFVGGYVGWQMAQDTYFSEDDARREWYLPEPDLLSNEYSEEEIARFEQLKMDFENQVKMERLMRQVQSYTGATTQEEDKVDEYDNAFREYGWLVYQPAADSKVLFSDQVAYLDEEAQQVAQKPYLSHVTNFDSTIILTAGCFRATECTYSGLYAYDTDGHTLRTLKTSSFYVPMYSSSFLSPDGTKILLSPYTEYKAIGTEIGYIDVVNDTYHSLEKLDPDDTNRFSVCEMGCSMEAKWNSASEVSATLLEYDNCDQYGQCTSPYKDETGVVYESTRPTSSTTKTWPI